MSSLFTTIPGKTIKVNKLGQEHSVPFYLQFVQGTVVDVVHSSESFRYRGDKTLNTIIAIPWLSSGPQKTKNVVGEEYRYYPLLRSVHDLPSKGDPVLLCTFGHIKYYLGPLNSMENSPTWNDDPSFIPELIITADESGKQTVRGVTGESPNFNKTLYKRLGKIRKNDLDFGDAVFETTGDTLIEGRHGNSLRIGSRSNNPYVFISNKRKIEQPFESLSDGGLISITSNGSLQQHFGTYFEGDLQYFGTGDDIFIMSSDTIDNATERIDTIYKDFNNGVNDIYQYGYDDFNGDGIDANQILISSDRITLNTKLDDIFISSKRDVHLGGGRNISLSANNSVVFQTSQFNIGNPNKKEMSSMVLGEELQDVLTQIVELISQLEINTSLGPQTPTMATGGVGEGGPKLQATLSNIQSAINEIISTKHKIEGN